MKHFFLLLAGVSVFSATILSANEKEIHTLFPAFTKMQPSDTHLKTAPLPGERDFDPGLPPKFHMTGGHWELWKEGVHPHAVSATNPSPGRIEYEFIGGGGSGNRGDYILFWLKELKPRQFVYHVKPFYRYYWFAPVNNWGNTSYVQEFEYRYAEERYFTDRAAAYAYAQEFPATPPPWGEYGPGDEDSFFFDHYDRAIVEVSHYEASAPRWVVVHVAQTPNDVGNPHSPMAENWKGKGSFNYDPALVGGTLVAQKFNLQRTAGDDNKVQYDYYTLIDEVLAGEPSKPKLRLTGPSGDVQLNP